jgi:UDP-N-acetylglucosamine--N-acetylmuramyl-(pentapeptide) pyrophosphoryl-undecaprenol N-acetylglucosamine transferase
MPRVLYGVSPIGLGHATRSLVVIEELKRRGIEVKVFSGGKAADFLRSSGVSVEDMVDDPVPTVIDGEMRRVALWYVRSWLANRRTLARTERLFDAYSPDLVVCDEEFSGLIVAGRKGTRRVFITDELLLGFARSWIARKIERRLERWYRNLQDSVDLLIVPDSGEDTGNRRFVGPIVRAQTQSCPEVRTKHKLPKGKMVLFSMSGSGIGRDLASKVAVSMKEARIEDTLFVVTGNRGPRISGEGIFDLGLVSENQDLIACSDLVVSTAGKSTIDEASAAGTPIVVIPIRHHAEQERNAQALGYSADDVGRLGAIIRERIGRRTPPRHFEGEIIASDAIMSLTRP